MKTYRAMYKCELARAAGVSASVFSRWCSRHRNSLALLGATPRTKLLPPGAVRYLCEYYCIDPDLA